MRELALFAGAGGGILGGHLLGWRTVCAVEIDPCCRRVLLARQRDEILPRFPIWDDIRTFDGIPWRGAVDVVSGGFPCQDISVQGRGAGIDGARSGLWRHMARVVCEVRSRFVLVENSPALATRGLGVVLGDLAAMGFDARWGVLSAAAAGAPHVRERLWILAYANGGGDDAPAVAEDDRSRADRGELPGQRDTSADGSGSGCWWRAEPGVGRMADGLAHGMDRLRALGNGQVPAVVSRAWHALGGRP